MRNDINPRGSSRRILIVVDCEVGDVSDDEACHLAEAIAGSHVLVVAPAGPVPAERWIADRTVREAHARRRLVGWTEVLSAGAESVVAEVGDPDPRLAVADARAGFAAQALISVGAASPTRERTPVVAGATRRRVSHAVSAIRRVVAGQFEVHAGAVAER